MVPVITDTIEVAICEGDSYLFAGEPRTVGGIYSDTLVSGSGCDSIITLILTVNPVYATEISASICQGQTYLFNGLPLSVTGVYTANLQSEAGCDSTLVLTLTVNPIFTTSLTAEICQGESYEFGGLPLGISGVYRDTLTAVNGCDSIVVLTLTVNPVATTNIAETICEGQSYLFYGDTLSAPGIYTADLQTTTGCDSTVTLNLTVIQTITENISAIICSGENYDFNGRILIQAGIYIDTLSTTFGCDSIVILSLSLHPPVEPIITGNALICEGDATVLTATNAMGDILWSTMETTGSVTVTAAGWYYLTVTDANGCAGIDSFQVQYLPPAIPPVGPNLLLTCSDSIVALGVIPAPAGAYQWSGPGINASNENEPNPRVDLPGWYQLSYTNAAGCTAKDSVLVELDPSVPVASAGPDMLLTCSLTAVSLQGNASPPGLLFVWSGPGINASNINAQTPSVSVPGWYTLTGVDTQNNCQSRPDSVFVDQNIELPEVEVQSDALLDCINLQVLVDGSGSSSGPEFTYTWTTPVAVITDSTSLWASQGGWFILTVQNTLTGCVASDSIFIVNNLNYPVAAIVPPGELTCAVTSIELSGMGSSEGSNISYSWQGPAGGIVSGQNTLTPSVQLPGVYILTVVNEGNGCSNTASAQVMQDIAAPVVNLPEEVFLSCITLTALIQPVEVSQGNNFSYNWSTLDGNIVQVQNQVNALVDEEGMYFLEVSDNQNGCVSIDSVPVGAPRPPFGVTLNITNTCYGESTGSIVVAEVAGGVGPFSYTLSGGPFPVTGLGAFGGLSEGAYGLRLVDANGCQWDTTIVITQLNQIVVDLGPDITILLGESTRLEAQVNLDPGAIASYSWNPEEGLSCTDCYNPLISPLDNVSYLFEVIDTNGCHASDFIHIYVDKRPPVFIPNIFSPNGDGINDVFMIFAGDAVKSIKLLRIFDRWGDMVFEIEDFLPNDPQFGWDGRFKGRMMNNAVFVYYTVVELINGDEVVLKGDVTLAK